MRKRRSCQKGDSKEEEVALNTYRYRYCVCTDMATGSSCSSFKSNIFAGCLTFIFNNCICLPLGAGQEVYSGFKSCLLLWKTRWMSCKIKTNELNEAKKLCKAEENFTTHYNNTFHRTKVHSFLILYKAAALINTEQGSNYELSVKG